MASAVRALCSDVVATLAKEGQRRGVIWSVLQVIAFRK